MLQRGDPPVTQVVVVESAQRYWNENLTLRSFALLSFLSVFLKYTPASPPAIVLSVRSCRRRSACTSPEHRRSTLDAAENGRAGKHALRTGGFAGAVPCRGAGRESGRQPHRDAEAAAVAWGEDEGSVVRVGDALHDREAEADARIVGADALAAALKRL